MIEALDTTALRPPTAEEAQWLAAQREAARRFLMEQVPGVRDLALPELDRAFDQWAEGEPTDPEAVNGILVAVAVALGWALVEEAGFSWAVAPTMEGPSFALRRGELLAYPLHLLAAHWEHPQPAFLEATFASLAGQAEALEPKRPWWRFWED